MLGFTVGAQKLPKLGSHNPRFSRDSPNFLIDDDDDDELRLSLLGPLASNMPFKGSHTPNIEANIHINE